MTEKESTPVSSRQPEAKSPCRVTCHMGDQVIQGTSLHFSERGILVLCDHPAPLTTKLRLILEFPGFKNTIDVAGEVVWTNVYGAPTPLAPRGMGIKFIGPDREVERMLADLGSVYDNLGSVFGCYYT